MCTLYMAKYGIPKISDNTVNVNGLTIQLEYKDMNLGNF